MHVHKDLNTDLTLGNCLFGAVKLNKNADPDTYEHSGYGIGFDSHSLSLFLELIIVFCAYSWQKQKYLSSW